jgi:hypothetical protein
VRRTQSLLLFVTLICVVVFPALAHGQQWSGIIAPSRAIDWSNAGVLGGIPNRTVFCASLNPGASPNQINSAIQSCPANEVVFLNAGTYNVSGGIAFNGKSGVTLRGAGADQTFLVFSSGNSCHGFSADICIDSSDTNWVGGASNSANWTAGYAKGTTAITLSSVTNLKVGSPIELDQNDDASDPGNIYHCQTNSSSPPCSLEGNNNGSRPNRDQQQIVQVVSCGSASTPGQACNGTNVVITPALYADNWVSGKAPGAWWATSPVSGDGVENLSITTSSGDRGMEIFNAIDCWVSGTRGINAGKSHVEILTSARVTVQNSYFYLTQNGVSQSYGVSPTGSTDLLVQNDIFQYISTPLQINGCIGCVLSYNYAINNYYEGSAGWIMSGFMGHTAGTDFILLEGNIGDQLDADVFHGSHNQWTIFRNQLIGNEPVCFSGSPNSFSACVGPKIPVELNSWSREFNVIGNVLGQAGTQTGYETGTPIFDIGSGNTEGSVTVPGDPLVGTTLMRWGNYDTVNAAVRFVASEVPSGLASYANPVPASQTLPASLYLNSKPAWFGTIPWPAIGPDVTGGNIAGVAGHANMIPANVCYSNIMGGPANGTGGVLTFNADACYNTSNMQRPNPPTNLTILVQ